jgi:Spo12 family
MSSTHQQQPLAERPANIGTSPSKDPKPPSKTMFADLKASDNQQGNYISPSDNILSPTSKKLSAIKGKRFAAGKPQSLFAKTVSRQGMKSVERFAGEEPLAGEDKQ